MSKTIILGAGFSKNSGIPVQAEIPPLLIKAYPEDAFENAVSGIIKSFMQDVFGYSGANSPPSLDDIMTCIDLSTNSGHHLGIWYTPMRLRALRRFLVYRIYSILEEYYKPDEVVSEFVKKVAVGENGFVVLNWDTILEKYIHSLYPGTIADYCNSSLPWIERVREGDSLPVKIAKVHGSCNWLYCDNCRTLFNDAANNVSIIKRAGIVKSDAEVLTGRDFPFKNALASGIPEEDNGRNCRVCSNPVSSHIATFSYRKSFRANAFPDIWREAEKLLCNSESWVFVGYSLPEADYEFKHLLKISQLKLNHLGNKNILIDVILHDSDETEERYRTFFGKSLNRVFNGGLKEYLGAKSH